MVNEKVIYPRPNANPDGGDLYRHTAQTSRSSIRPTDSNGNGLLDDDSPQDLNGDGYITRMRKEVGGGNGDYIVDGRDPIGYMMRVVGEGEATMASTTRAAARARTASAGSTLHRNYPSNWRPMPGQDETGRGWTQTGAGEYPLSEPEIPSTFLFWSSTRTWARSTAWIPRPTRSCVARPTVTTRSVHVQERHQAARAPPLAGEV
jgi:hypothetical protein